MHFGSLPFPSFPRKPLCGMPSGKPSCLRLPLREPVRGSILCLSPLFVIRTACILFRQSDNSLHSTHSAHNSARIQMVFCHSGTRRTDVISVKNPKNSRRFPSHDVGQSADGVTFCSCGKQTRRAPCACCTFSPVPVHQRNSWFLPHSINNVGWMVLLSVLAGCSHAALRAQAVHSRLYQFIKEIHGSYLTLSIMLDGWSYFLFLRDAVMPRSVRRLYILACTSSSKKFMVLTSLYQ